MEDSLSILLPVYNSQATLGRDVERLLEEAAELGHPFDVLIIDDGSNDGTEEAAWELQTRYAQVRCARHPFRLGLVEAIRTGLSETDGEFLLICNASQSLRGLDIGRLWASRHDAAPSASATAVHDTAHATRQTSTWLRRLIAWGRRIEPEADRVAGISGLHLVRRRDIAELSRDMIARRETYLERIRRAHQIPRLPVVGRSGGDAAASRRSDRTEAQPPNWHLALQRVRDFALGE